MRTRDVLGTLTATLLAVSLLGGCAPPTEPGEDPSRDGSLEPTPLERSEVREYEGRDLSSVDDFPENSIERPQQVDLGDYRLRVSGLVNTPLELTYDEVVREREHFEKVVSLSCVEGWSVDILWEGVLLSDLLEQAGADPEASVIIFRAYDGYSTSLPAEYVRDKGLLLAYKMNGIDLPAERGFPFQLVAEERWGYKWVKWVTEIEVSDDTSFRGYWESRGYSNEGDITRSSRE